MSILLLFGVTARLEPESPLPECVTNPDPRLSSSSEQSMLAGHPPHPTANEVMV